MRDAVILGVITVCGGVAGFTAAQVAHDDAPGCHTEARAAVVDLRPDHRPVWEHIRDAVRRGQPVVTHIARDEIDANRRASLRGIDTEPGKDRDEWPMAMSDEGGAGADVALVPSGPNRSSGSLIGRTLRPYCDGQAFRVVR